MMKVEEPLVDVINMRSAVFFRFYETVSLLQNEFLSSVPILSIHIIITYISIIISIII